MLDIHASMLFLAARVRAPSGGNLSAYGTCKPPATARDGNERVRLVAPHEPITCTI